MKARMRTRNDFRIFSSKLRIKFSTKIERKLICIDENEWKIIVESLQQENLRNPLKYLNYWF